MDIRAIEKWLIEKATAYYEGRRSVSDAEFDDMVSKLKIVSPNHPYLTIPGWGYAPKDGIRHKVQIKTDIVRCVDFEDFISRFDDSGKYKIIPKIDGITVILYYSNYRIEKILTRGNGIVGRRVVVNPVWEVQIAGIGCLLNSFGGEGAVICSACLPSENEFGKARDIAAEVLLNGDVRSADIKLFAHSLIIRVDEQELFVDSNFLEITKPPTRDEVKALLKHFQTQGYDCDGIVLRQKSNRYVHYC